MVKRKSYTSGFKLKVALEAIRSNKTINQIASEYSVSPSLICDWKKYFIKNGSQIFQKTEKRNKDKSEDVDFLQQHIGKLTVELEWLKKKLGLT